jgi:hypothetical protein
LRFSNWVPYKGFIGFSIGEKRAGFLLFFFDLPIIVAEKKPCKRISREKLFFLVIIIFYLV